MLTNSKHFWKEMDIVCCMLFYQWFNVCILQIPIELAIFYQLN